MNNTELTKSAIGKSPSAEQPESTLRDAAAAKFHNAMGLPRLVSLVPP